MTEDAHQLARFAKKGDETAFRELVTRHFDLVYSAALRQLNDDTHLAEDVAQLVFTDLARKAGVLPRGIVLAGWLYEAARRAAANAVRGEQRRRKREKEAITMHEPEPSADWEEISPILDAAMGQLGAQDRNAVLLHYFEGKGFRAIGTVFGISDDTAQKTGAGEASFKASAVRYSRGGAAPGHVVERKRIPIARKISGFIVYSTPVAYRFCAALVEPLIQMCPCSHLDLCVALFGNSGLSACSDTIISLSA